MPTTIADSQSALKVLRKFRLIYGSMRQHFRRMEEASGLSGSHLWVLQEVQRQPSIGVSALAECLSIHQSTCSQIVDKLVASGHLRKTRNSTDQRRIGLTLGESASDLLAAVPGPVEGLLPQALMQLSPRALDQLDRALSNVIEQLPARNERLGKHPLADL